MRTTKGSRWLSSFVVLLASSFLGVQVQTQATAGGIPLAIYSLTYVILTITGPATTTTTTLPSVVTYTT